MRTIALSAAFLVAAGTAFAAGGSDHYGSTNSTKASAGAAEFHTQSITVRNTAIMGSHAMATGDKAEIPTTNSIKPQFEH
ncbi:hypothetical protein [Mesorhizobium huakuii]|uniref:DUF680 domain-containing protein n=1 Tax=Mesorhizobium huakuii TaxID=28104 RepID=A0A7G6ST81_9HYPH|nr:hypothetical protein [Mesorhizobium huakuii]QND57713.1 hypothetical protein HB778_14685 [Mesorhizobium huakuii]